MKLASLKEDGRDGTLIVVNRAVTQAVKVPDIARTMQIALDDWADIAPKLEAVYVQLQNSVVNVNGLISFEKIVSNLIHCY